MNKSYPLVVMGAAGTVAVLPTAVVLRPWVRVGGGVREEVGYTSLQCLILYYIQSAASPKM